MATLHRRSELFLGLAKERGLNTLVITMLQGFDYWRRHQADYFSGTKAEYNLDKEEMADLVMDHLEQGLLPGLRDAVEVREVATPLTNLRFVGAHRGAAYGYDQRLDNANDRRLPHSTPTDNL